MDHGSGQEQGRAMGADDFGRKELSLMLRKAEALDKLDR
jgi:hypothetical protein